MNSQDTLFFTQKSRLGFLAGGSVKFGSYPPCTLYCVDPNLFSLSRFSMRCIVSPYIHSQSILNPSLALYRLQRSDSQFTVSWIFFAFKRFISTLPTFSEIQIRCHVRPRRAFTQLRGMTPYVAQFYSRLYLSLIPEIFPISNPTDFYETLSFIFLFSEPTLRFLC